MEVRWSPDAADDLGAIVRHTQRENGSATGRPASGGKPSLSAQAFVSLIPKASARISFTKMVNSRQ